MTFFMLLGLWLLAWSSVLWRRRRALRAIWLEPVLRRPVLILESDDWGAGPRIQAEKLRELIRLLQQFHDGTGHHPVVTLGVVLATADSARIRAEGFKAYYRLSLDDGCFKAIVEAMRDGEAAGVFALQLHGMEHYWPEAMMLAGKCDPAVRGWLTSAGEVVTESLPSHLQSRWTDASVLPSREIVEEKMCAAVAEETGLFAHVFGLRAKVAVPPTFLWNRQVEQAWYEHGVKIVVTPGRINTHRGEHGQVVAEEGRIYNRHRSPSGCHYIVRDDYFEPGLGHTALQGLAALRHKTEFGRPTLLEMHRFNFINDDKEALKAYRELDELLNQALLWSKELRFMSTEQLVHEMGEGNQELIETRFSHRFYFFLRRAADLPKLRKLAWVTGAIIPVGIVIWLIRPSYVNQR